MKTALRQLAILLNLIPLLGITANGSTNRSLTNVPSSGKTINSRVIQAAGVKVKWDGEAKDSLWSNATNWSGDKLPAENDTIIIDTKIKVDAKGMANSGYLPSNSVTTVSGGAILTVSSGAIRMSRNTINVASDGGLEGDWWDMDNGSFNFEDGASVNLNNWENKGTNVFGFKLGKTGFKTLIATNFYIGGGATIANSTFFVNMANYTGSEGKIVLVDIVENKAGITAESFKKAKLIIRNSGNFANSTITFDETTNDIVLNVIPGVPVSGIWDGEAGDGLWSTALNWSDNKLPAEGATIVIDSKAKVDAAGMPNSGYLPANSVTTVSGGATLTVSSGAVRMNRNTLTVASDGILTGEWWDLDNGTLNFFDGASVNIKNWENKGTNVFNFKLGESGFKTLNATNLQLGGGTTMANATYNVDLANYTGGETTIILVDFAENKAGITAADFKKAKLNVTNVGSLTNTTISFDDLSNDIVLNIRPGDQVVGIKWDDEAKDGLWTSALNWSTNKLPGSGDHIILDSEFITDTYGMPNSGYLPSNCTIDVDGGATFTNSIGAIRLNGCVINAGSKGNLAGDFWDMSNGTINVVDGAVVELSHLEVKGNCTLGFKLSEFGFSQIFAAAFRSGNGAVWSNVTFNIDISNYKISNGDTVTLAAFNYHDPLFDGTFDPVINIVSGNSKLGAKLTFDKLANALVLIVNSVSGVKSIDNSNDVYVRHNNSSITITGEAKNYKIVNMIGQTISQGLIQNQTTIIPMAKKGIYIVSGTKNNGNYYSKKLVVR